MPKVGLLVGGYAVPAWIFAAVERVVHDGAVEVALVAATGLPVEPERGHGAIWKLGSALDQRVFKRNPDAFAPRELRELLPDAALLELQGVAAAGVEDTDWARAIAGYGLDVLVDFGAGAEGETLADCARYGLWAYRHGGFWEVVECVPATATVLYGLPGAGQEDVSLAKSWLMTYGLSMTRNQNFGRWQAALLLSRALGRLAAGEHPSGGGRAVAEEPLRREPGFLRSCGLVCGFAWHALNLLIRRKSCEDEWRLLVALGEEPVANLDAFRSIELPPGKYWADPHLVCADGRTYIFVEEYAFATRKAHLSVLEIDADGNCGPATPILEKDTHLSYPFVFQADGRYYMIPESMATRTVELYEAVEFPYRWEHRLNLMEDVGAVDATLMRRDGQWWMFVGIAEDGAVAAHNDAAYNTELFLFSSPELLTDRWQPHPLNPIVSDVRNARPAGPVFEKDGRWYRPAQDCAERYGHGININEIVALSAREYAEKTAFSIKPEPGDSVAGVHTYACGGGLTVIDGVVDKRIIF